MSLAAVKAAGPTPARKGSPCTVGVLLLALPETEAEALTGLLDDPLWQSEQIAKTLQAEVGSTIAGTTIARHRRGGCKCEPR